MFGCPGRAGPLKVRISKSTVAGGGCAVLLLALLALGVQL